MVLTDLLKLVGANVGTISEAKVNEHELASELKALHLTHASVNVIVNKTAFIFGRERTKINRPSCFRDW